MCVCMCVLLLFTFACIMAFMLELVFTTLALAATSFFIFSVLYDTVCCYWFTPRRIKNKMAKQGVRGPKPRPLLGNILDIAALLSNSTSSDMPSISHDLVPRLLPHFLAWSAQYGKRLIMFWNGIEQRMCLMETDLIKELLSKHNMVSGKSWLQQEGSKHFIGRGLLMANGRNWSHQRHIVAPAFVGHRLKSYARYMVECTREMLESIQNEVNSGRSELEIGEYMTTLTADIISRTEFESSYVKGKQIFDLLTVLQNLCAQASRHLILPGSRFFPSKYNREIKALKGKVEGLLMEIIESRKESVEIGGSSSYGNDLLGMLLNEMQKKKDGNGLSLNLQTIMDECKTFFFAGHETTALLLTWTAMLLAANPSWQQKVRDEVVAVCNGETPSLDHLSKLTQLSMVINESLRLYPPATILPRMAFEDIRLGDLEIPKGVSIWIPLLALHHSEELWGKDANEFNPQRFSNSKPFTSGRFIPFASGPRNCLGQSFAIMEAKIILAMLISKFTLITISPNYRHSPIVVLTIKPKYGLQLIINPLPLN